MSGSTYSWTGAASSAWTDSGSWSFVSGTNNGYPQPGDTAIDTGSGTILTFTGSELSGNTIDLSNGATIAFDNGSTLDGSSVVNGINGVVNVNGLFTDYGNLSVMSGDTLTVSMANSATLLSNGPTYSGPGTDIGINDGLAGYFNGGTLYVLGGTLDNQEVHVNGGYALVTSALESNDELSVDGGTLEIAQQSTVSPQQLTFSNADTTVASTMKFDVPGSFNGDGLGTIDLFTTGDTIDIASNTVGTLIYSGVDTTNNLGTLTLENSAGNVIFSAELSGADASSLQQGTFTISGTAGTFDAGSLQVVQGPTQDTLISESGTTTPAAATWSWIGTTGSYDVASNWTLTAGSSSNTYPANGDSAIIPSGTMEISGATLDLASLSVGGASAGGVALSSSGDLEVNSGLVMLGGSTLSIDGTSGMDLGTSGTYTAGAVGIDSGVSLVGSGTINAAVVNNGGLISSNAASPSASTGGTLEVTGSIGGSGGITLAAGSTLKLDGAVGSGQAITFAAGAPEALAIGTPGTAFSNAITGLANGDEIELGNGMTITSASLVNPNTIAVDFTAGGTSGVYDLTNVSFAGGAGTTFSVGIDSATGDGEFTLTGASPLTVTAGGSASYVAGAAATTLDAALSVSDTEASTLTSATVSITAGFLAGDILNLGTTEPGITSSYNATTGVLTLSGTASVATYQAALDSVTYASSADPTGSGADPSRTITWSANDGTTISNAATSTLSTSFLSNPSTDILFQNTDGQVGLWQINGTTRVAYGAIGTDPGSSWYAVATGAFFPGDSSDIVWQNASGQVGLWQVQGTTMESATAVGSNPGTTWHVKGTGVFFNDGNTDILWQNDNGQVGLWDMSGTTVVQTVAVGSSPGSSWQIVGTGDFYGDGNTDILFQNTDGQVGIWDIQNGTTVVHMATIGSNPGPSWHVVGTGDFYGDGNTDILFQNTDGAVGIWDIANGTTIMQSGAVTNNPGSTWHIVGTGNFGGGGNADIVWQSDTGAIGAWSMDGTSIVSMASISNPGTTWSVTGDDSMRFIYSTAANETLAATPPLPDEFVFTNAAAGSHTITGFNTALDTIDLSAAQFSNFAAVEAATTNVAGSAVINLGNSNSLTLTGVNPSSLQSSNFLFT